MWYAVYTCLNKELLYSPSFPTESAAYDWFVSSNWMSVDFIQK